MKFEAIRHVAPFLLLALLSACGEKTWSSCKDAECRASIAEKTYAEHPNEVLQYLSVMQDPIEQLSLLELLSLAYPDDINTFCGTVPNGSPAQMRCSQIELRPHLYTDARLGTSKDRFDTRLATGPAESVPMRSDLPPPWDESKLDVKAIKGSCGEDRTCLGDLGLRLAMEGKAVEGGQACVVAWPADSVARDECLFRVAETVASVAGMAASREVLALCSQAIDIGRNCTQHVLIELIPDPPPADTPDVRSVAEAVAAAASLRDGFGEPQKTFYPDYFWAVWTRDAFRDATEITGHLLAALPPEAAVHVRDAAAWRLANSTPEAFTDVDRVAGYLKGRLAITGPLLDLPPHRESSDPRVMGEQPGAFWSQDRNDLERAIPSAIFIGSGRRATSTNPDDDLRIAVLEAGARVSPPLPAEFFLNVLGTDQAEVVRWTAARLVSVLYGPALRTNLITTKSDLVRDALTYAHTGSM